MINKEKKIVDKEVLKIINYILMNFDIRYDDIVNAVGIETPDKNIKTLLKKINTSPLLFNIFFKNMAARIVNKKNFLEGTIDELK